MAQDPSLFTARKFRCAPSTVCHLAYLLIFANLLTFTNNLHCYAVSVTLLEKRRIRKISCAVAWFCISLLQPICYRVYK